MIVTLFAVVAPVYWENKFKSLMHQKITKTNILVRVVNAVAFGFLCYLLRQMQNNSGNHELVGVCANVLAFVSIMRSAFVQTFNNAAGHGH